MFAVGVNAHACSSLGFCTSLLRLMFAVWRVFPKISCICRTVWTVGSCAHTSISGLSLPIQMLLVVASSGLVLTLHSQRAHVTHLSHQADSCKQELGPQSGGSGFSDHVLAQARVAGLLRCTRNLVVAMQRRLDHVLAQACYRLVAVQRRRCIVCDS